MTNNQPAVTYTVEAVVQQYDAFVNLVKENQELKTFQRLATDRIKALDEQLSQCGCAPVIGAEGTEA